MTIAVQDAHSSEQRRGMFITKRPSIRLERRSSKMLNARTSFRYLCYQISKYDVVHSSSYEDNVRRRMSFAFPTPNEIMQRHQSSSGTGSKSYQGTVRFAFSEVAPSPNCSSLNVNNRSMQVHYNGPWFWYLCRISQKSQAVCRIAQRYQSPSLSLSKFVECE